MDFENDGRLKDWEGYARKIRMTEAETFKYLKSCV